MRAFLLLLPFILADAPAPPAITPGSIFNAASLVPPSLAAGGIAVGARIRIEGVRLGPDTPVRGSESDPPSRLAEVTVRISQSSRSVEAGLFSVSARRIEAWIPADAPLGDVRLTVTYEGRTSEPYALHLVDSAPGFFTSDAPAASPGGVITLHATGVGSSGLRVFVAGRHAPVVRVSDDSCCRGIQRVEVGIPAGVPQGCAVPVQALTRAGRPTNAVAVSIHPPRQPCRDEVDWFRETVEHAARAGFVVLVHALIHTGLEPDNRLDYGIAGFARQEQGRRVFPPLPPSHTCTAFTMHLTLRQTMAQIRSPREWTAIPEEPAGSRALDAGPAIQVRSGASTAQLSRDPNRRGYYSAMLGGGAPFGRKALPDFLHPGLFTISAAGADVAPFNVALDVPDNLVWTNRTHIRTVNRSRGVTVRWKAARPDAAVVILAFNVDHFNGGASLCLCMAPARDGRFSIPPLPLSSIPPSGPREELPTGLIALVEMPAHPPAHISAPGLDAAFAAFVSASASVVRFR